MTRLKAALIHLMLSSSALLLLSLVTVLYWYPDPHFKYEGALQILYLIALIDVVLGPLFTFIVFKPGKPGLKFDLSVIAIIQIAAFVYGSVVIYSQYPAFMVYTKGMMVTIPAAAVDLDKVGEDSLRSGWHPGPRLAVPRLPDDVNAQIEFTIDQIRDDKTLIESPEFYRPYPPNEEEIAAAALDIEQVSKIAGTRAVIEAFFATSGYTVDQVFFLRMVSHLKTTVVVVAKPSLLPVAYLDIPPS